LKSKARRKSRKLVLQALYQWQLTDNDIAEIEMQSLESPAANKIDHAYFSKMFHEIPAQVADIDRQYAPFLARKLEDVDPIEKAILRIGTYELLGDEVPYKVAINEAIELAKTFGSEKSHQFVNHILDQVAKQCRKTEME